MANSSARRKRFENRPIRRADDCNPWPRVLQKVLYFVRSVRNIDRHKHGAHAQAGNVEQHRLRRFIHLHRDSVARHDAPLQQGASEAAGLLVQRSVAALAASSRLKK